MLGEIPDVTIRKISLNFDLHQNLDLYFHGILNFPGIIAEIYRNQCICQKIVDPNKFQYYDII